MAFEHGHARSLCSTLNPANSYAAATGSTATAVVTELPVKHGVAGYAVASGQAIAVHDVDHDPRFDREAAEATGYIPRSILAVPIETTDGVSGVIEVLDWSDGRVGEEGLELAGMLHATGWAGAPTSRASSGTSVE